MPKVDIWSRLTPQSRAAVEKSREQYAVFETGSTDALAVMREGYNHERRYWNSVRVDLPSVQDSTLNAPGGPIALRLYKPSTDGLLPVLVYAHGGGFMLGNLDTHDRICRLLAQRSGWAVLAIDYTLGAGEAVPGAAGPGASALLQHVAATAPPWAWTRNASRSAVTRPAPT
jgi:acetyl esterase